VVALVSSLQITLAVGSKGVFCHARVCVGELVSGSGGGVDDVGVGSVAVNLTRGVWGSGLFCAGARSEI